MNYEKKKIQPTVRDFMGAGLQRQKYGERQ